MSSFIDYLKVEKGLGALTVSAYMRDIGQFAAFLDGRKRTLLNARKDEVRGFIQQLFANSVDGRSVARKLSGIRHLYRFLLLDWRIERDPTLNIPLPSSGRCSRNRWRWKKLNRSLQAQAPYRLVQEQASTPVLVRTRPYRSAIALCSKFFMRGR